jgi:hypothetical protein
MSKLFYIPLPIFLISSPALADDWSGKLTIEAAPAFGQKDAFDLDESPVDEGEYKISVAAISPKVWRDQKLTLTVGATSSPQLLDGQQPKSSNYFEVKFGDTYENITRIMRSDSSILEKDVQDAWRPYVSLRHTNNYDGLLSDRTRSGQELSGGIRYRDIRSIMCATQMDPASEAGTCSATPGVSYELRAEVLHAWSTDDNREMMQYTGRADIVSRPIANIFRLYGRGRADRMVFENAVTPGNEKQRDWRFRLGAGINFAPLLDPLKRNFSFDVEFRHQWLDSNNPAKDKNDFHLIATLTWALAIK